MPTYEFRCVNNHVFEMDMDIGETCRVPCPTCGAEMRRRFTMPFVNWNGLKPSQGEIHPAIKEHIERAQENRERILQEKEERNV